MRKKGFSKAAAALAAFFIFGVSAWADPSACRSVEPLRAMAWRGRQEHGYQEAKRYLFAAADNVARDGEPGVVAAYSGIFVPGASGDGADYKEDGDLNRDGFVDSDGMNVEHLWPQSLFHKRNLMRSDLHVLLPTFMHPNSVRGNLPFDEVRGERDYANSAGARRGGGAFEPPDAVKGRVARALLYFYASYCGEVAGDPANDRFWERVRPAVLLWNRRFPPDDAERSRNGRVQAYQGNRNPFVDDPSLADALEN